MEKWRGDASGFDAVICISIPISIIFGGCRSNVDESVMKTASAESNLNYPWDLQMNITKNEILLQILPKGCKKRAFSKR